MKKMLLLCFALLAGACQTLPTSSEYQTRGDGFFKDGKAAKAVTAYNKALKLNPDNFSVYASRGSAYFFMGEYQLAAEDFMQVLKANPYQVDAYTALGSALAALGDYQNALTILNLALQLDPGKPEIFFSRAGVLVMQGQFDDAVRDYTSVINLKPAADVYNARGAVYLRQGKQDLADQDFETAKSGRIPQKLNDYTMID